MSAPVVANCLADLLGHTRAGRFGASPGDLSVSVGFVTRQGVRHASRGQGYRNHVVSLRVGQAVGSCAVEPDSVNDNAVYDCVGSTVDDLLDHPVEAIRVAALDAYLMSVRPHERHATETMTIPAGSSLDKSMARAERVIDLLDPQPGQRVLVIGVVNSLLHHLRGRGIAYVACDLKGGVTEWGEPVITDAARALGRCDTILASGMTLGNGTLDALLDHARSTGKPLTLFAQTGSAVLPWFVGSGVRAVAAEPYPFFWLDGGPTTVHHYLAPPLESV
ncbi:Rossmann-like domain-containing protein [Actinokineospora iranica]|uniref:Putative heavy-metal chelation n=1 Tax=Actinokineospora iranica TaxID=1271860 RepID=A0A1G6S2J5_9PSEU|nr:DUF364 domain-containing protein [Actinokineospora iranica]SDD10903.1 Putative heavy-metal chelation [Actinokineospora iranica]